LIGDKVTEGEDYGCRRTATDGRDQPLLKIAFQKRRSSLK
jgi:hypothetical protein